MSKFSLLFINGAILMACAVFIYDSRAWVLTALMLLMPFIDKNWRGIESASAEMNIRLWLVVIFLCLLLIYFNPQHTRMFFIILFLVALPEEWFFRGYIQRLLQQNIEKTINTGSVKSNATKAFFSVSEFKAMWLVNLVTSCFFVLIHLPLQGLQGLMVLFPSLVFGWLYQRNRDLVLVILLHALSNLFFIIYIREISWLKVVF